MFVTRSLALLVALIRAVTAGPKPPPGAVVVKSGGNLQNIVNANAGKTIFIEAGKYPGPIVIKSKITLIGASDSDGSYGGNKVTITINRSQESGFNNHHTAAVQIEADGVNFYNINFENTWKHQEGKNNQALAVSTMGDQIGFYGCKFDSFQDTIETEGKGAKSTGKQVFAKCLIQGATDFIFGKTAAAWFENCDIRVKNTGEGWVTAQGRESSNGGGHYVFNKCNVAGGTANSAFLGRPWRPYAEVTFQYTKLSNVIKAAGWSKWKPNNASEPTNNLVFQEFQNSGPGAAKSRQLGKQASAAASISKTLGGGYSNWVDMKYIEK